MNKKWRRLFGLVLVFIMLSVSGTGAVEDPKETEIAPAPVIIPLGHIAPELLADLRENMADAATLFVLYTLKIIDLGATSTWDWIFSGEISSGKPAGNFRIVATPQVLQGDNGIRFLAEKGSAERTGVPESQSYKGVTEAWLIAVPGRTVKWRTGSTRARIYPEDYDKDENFVLQITPTFIHRDTGRVETKVFFERDDENHGELAALTTTVYSEGGKPEIIALMRRTIEREQGRFLTAGLKEYRNFALVLTAVPLRLKNQAEMPVLPMASLEGLKPFSPRYTQVSEKERIVEAGLMINRRAHGRGVEINPVLHLAVPLGELTGLDLSVRGPNIYSIGVQRELWTGSGTFLEAALSSELGPAADPALLVGVCDSAWIFDHLHAFITWYPLAFPLYGRPDLGESNWRAGMEWDLGKIELALALTGNPRSYTKQFQASWRLQKDLWLRLGVIARANTHTENEVSSGIFLGVGLRHARAK